MASIATRRRRRRAQRERLREARAVLPPILAAEAAMPVRTASSGRGDWAIHGIAHGQRRFMRLSPEVRAFIAAAVDRWLAAGERVLLEPGLPHVLGLDDDLALDASNLFKRMPAREVLRLLARLVPTLALLPFAGVATRVSRDPEWRYIRAALRDPRALAPLADVHDRLQCPVALEGTAPSAGERFRRAYSDAMVEAALAARQPEDRVVHLVVGLAHVRDLAEALSD